MTTRTAFAAVVMLVTGCATIESGGFTVDQGDTEAAFAAVQGRFTFETGCAAKNTQLIVLDVMRHDPSAASQIGATGCDQRLVYVRTRSGWVLDSAGRDAPATSPTGPSTSAP